MRDRVANCELQMDLDSPRWRSVLNPIERRQYWRTKLIEKIGRRNVIPWLNKNDQIVASHRTRYLPEGTNK
jgi:hypothetical protein